MKECPSCKAKNKNDAAFCGECGTSLEGVSVTADEWIAAAGGLLNKAKNVASAGAKKAADAAQARATKARQTMEDAAKNAETARAASTSAGGWDSASAKNSGVLVDQSEQIMATIGSGYLQNYLAGGEVKTGVGILTQKRIYYKGQNFSDTGKDLKNTTEEGVVSINDITFTMFSHTKNIGRLVWGIILAVIGVFLFMNSTGPHEVTGFGSLVFMAMGLLSIVWYFISRRSLFVVSYPGGSFGFDIRYYPIADIRDFQRQLHLLKDHIKENG